MYLGQEKSDNVPADSSSDFSFFDMLTPAGKEFLTYQGLVDFGIGFINATEMYDIKNLQKCSSVIENTWIREAREAKEEAFAGMFFNAARSFLAMLSSSDEIAKDCYAGFYEMASTYNDTVKQYTPTAGTLSNAVYHFGQIYENL